MQAKPKGYYNIEGSITNLMKNSKARAIRRFIYANNPEPIRYTRLPEGVIIREPKRRKYQHAKRLESPFIRHLLYLHRFDKLYCNCGRELNQVKECKCVVLNRKREARREILKVVH